MLGLVPTAAAAPKSLNGFVGDGAGINTGGLFTQPRDAVVFQGNAGDPGDDKIFVVEALGGNSRVHRLDADGNFELLWGKDAIAPGEPGNAGDGYEVCTQAITGAAGCKSAPSGTAEGEFGQPTGVAVNESNGHVYVLDRNNRRVQEFDLDGGFIRAWGWGVDTGADAFEICTSTCGAGLTTAPGNSPGQFGALPDRAGIAVDPVSGDVFAADPTNRRVLRFNSDGTLDPNPAFGSAAEFSSGNPLRVIVDANGVLYASDNTASTNPINRYDTNSNAFLAPLPSPSLLSAGTTVGLEIDPITGRLFAARDPGTGPVTVDEIHDPDAPISPGGPPNPVLVETHAFADETIQGLGYSPANQNLYLLASGLIGPPDPSATFTGCAPTGALFCHGLIVLALPTGPLQAASLVPDPGDIGPTTVTVGGSVNAGGGVAFHRFQISSDGGSSWQDAAQRRYRAGSDSASVSAAISGLEPATPYKARLVIRKQTAMTTTSEAISNVVDFVTDPAAPDVDTLKATKRRDTTVQLRGLVDPNGADTSYRFEWGVAGGPLAEQTPPASAGAGNSLDLVTATLTGLEPSTDYEYRIVATNEVDTTEGDVEAFSTTDEISLPQPNPIGRAYELVSPADKLSGVGVGGWYNGPALSGIVGAAAHHGERFALKGSLGSVLMEGKYGYADDWVFAERTDSGWVSRDSMTRRAYGPQYITQVVVGAAAANLSRFAWRSNAHKVAIFPQMEGWENLFSGEVLLVQDWINGRWEVFSPTDPEQGGLLAEGPIAVADDGSATVASGVVRGLAGPGDPTAPAWDDLEAGSEVVYAHEAPPGGLSDTFPGEGERNLVNVCDEGTAIPALVDVSGTVKQGAQPCGNPLLGRDHRLISRFGAELGADVEGVISEDGSRIFFVAPEGAADTPCAAVGDACPPQLYIRQRNQDGDVVTRWISRTEVTQANGATADQDASLMSRAVFEAASEDGDKVFFRTNSPLTSDDRNALGAAPPAGGVTSGSPSSSSSDLYMYDLPDGPDADPAGGDLERITAGPHGDGECNSGTVRFVSDDGSRVYFTCAAPLSGVPGSANGTLTEPGGSLSATDATNLYVYDAQEPVAFERWRFVARLPRDETSPLGSCATTAVAEGASLGPSNDVDPKVSYVGTRSCIRGTADGELVTFWTDGRLMPDDPDAVTGDLYAYDAELDELTRITAPTDPAADPYVCAPGTSTVECYGDGGIGGAGGQLPLIKLGLAIDPLHPGDRLAFFESRSRLIAADTDDAYDVYQWRAHAAPGKEPELSLLSGGAGATDAFYAGNDDKGRNVYIATRAKLTWQDHDAVLDIYTARACGATTCPGIPEPPEHSACDPLANGCQDGGASPTPTDIGSGQAGEGNKEAGPRLTITLGGPSAAARRRAARTGVLRVPVRVSAPGLLRVRAKARIGGGSRLVASARKRVGKAGKVTVRLRLNRAARRRLDSGKALRLRLTVKASGARSQTKSTVVKSPRP